MAPGSRRRPSTGNGANVGDLVAPDGANLRRLQRHDGNRLAAEGYELDLKPSAGVVNEDNRANVPRLQTVLGEVLCQDNGFQFLHGYVPEAQGYAVTSRGVLSPAATVEHSPHPA